MDILEKIPILRQLNTYLEDLEEEVSAFVGKKIEEHFLSYFLYEFKVKELKETVENLLEKRDKMQQRVDEEYRNGKDTAEDVLKWFKQVDNMIEKIDEFWHDKRIPYAMFSKGYLPKPLVRYPLAKEAYRLAREVDSLCKTSFLDGVSSGLRPTSIDFLLSVVHFESFSSRKEVTDNISKALEDITIKMVGVYGTGGVGKTTLVKKVASTVQRKLFDVVIFATVTRNRDIKQFQGQLADQLGARLNEETEVGRASRLRDIFKKLKNNTLVILDDLWVGLDLNNLGIPVDDANPSPTYAKEMSKKEGTSDGGKEKEEATGDSKMLKILLTSRSKKVVLDQMQVKENSSFLIKGLEDQEAQILFKKMVGMVDKPLEFEPLATKISNKCGGLPIAIVTMGKTLKTKSYSQWKETLGQLERQEFTEVAESVDFSTRLSFNYLENDELKSIFLLCAQLGFNPLIMDLVKYCIGIGIFEGFLQSRKLMKKYSN